MADCCHRGTIPLCDFPVVRPAYINIFPLFFICLSPYKDRRLDFINMPRAKGSLMKMNFKKPFDDATHLFSLPYVDSPNKQMASAAVSREHYKGTSNVNNIQRYYIIVRYRSYLMVIQIRVLDSRIRR